MSKKRAITIYMDEDWIEWLKDLHYTRKNLMGDYCTQGSIIEEAMALYAEKLPLKIQNRPPQVVQIENERIKNLVRGRVAAKKASR